MPGIRLEVARQPRGPAPRGGFTLVEIIVAMSILALAAVALIRAFDVSLGWSGRSNERMLALTAAQQRLEQVRAWVDGAPDQTTRSTRFVDLDAPPWSESRRSLDAELARFERETVVADARLVLDRDWAWLSARTVTVRVYAGGQREPLAELVAVIPERP